MRLYPALITLSLIALTACDPYVSTPTPDYSIRVMKTPEGMVAIPPTCPSYATDISDPYDNQPQPQFGCATARNLAMMTERPSDLVDPRTLAPTSGVPMVGAMFRYNNNQTRGFIYPVSSPDSAVDVTTMSTAASSISGDVTGGLSGSGSSSSGGSSSTSTSSGASSTGTASSGTGGAAP